jgi:hypothetical protein
MTREVVEGRTLLRDSHSWDDGSRAPVELPDLHRGPDEGGAARRDPFDDDGSHEVTWDEV